MELNELKYKARCSERRRAHIVGSSEQYLSRTQQTTKSGIKIGGIKIGKSIRVKDFQEQKNHNTKADKLKAVQEAKRKVENKTNTILVHINTKETKAKILAERIKRKKQYILHSKNITELLRLD